MVLELHLELLGCLTFSGAGSLRFRGSGRWLWVKINFKSFFWDREPPTERSFTMLLGVFTWSTEREGDPFPYVSVDHLF